MLAVPVPVPSLNSTSTIGAGTGVSRPAIRPLCSTGIAAGRSGWLCPMTTSSKSSGRATWKLRSITSATTWLSQRSRSASRSADSFCFEYWSFFVYQVVQPGVVSVICTVTFALTIAMS